MNNSNLPHLKKNLEPVCCKKQQKKVEMEGFEDRFVSHIDYKGLAGTSVTLFEAVSLWNGLKVQKRLTEICQKLKQIQDSARRCVLIGCWPIEASQWAAHIQRGFVRKIRPKDYKSSVCRLPFGKKNSWNSWNCSRIWESKQWNSEKWEVKKWKGHLLLIISLSASNIFLEIDLCMLAFKELSRFFRYSFWCLSRK